MNKLFSKPIFWLILITFFAGLLRIPYLDKYPPALYSDEVSQGYNAFSILKTGKDEYGNFLPISFRSFGDWKPPLITYLMVPTIFLFGLNAYGIRLPSAILGTLTVFLMYLITYQLLNIFSNKEKLSDRNKQLISLFSALFLAISPWHILQSRSAMLVAVMLFCLCFSLWTFFKSFNNARYLYLSAVGFALTIYSYYGARLIVPLFLIMLAIFFIKHLKNNLRTVIFSCIIAGVLLLPLFINFLYEPDVVMGRAKTVSIFYDKGIKLYTMSLITDDGINNSRWVIQFLHNKYYYYAVDIIRRFLQHFDANFLFFAGDSSTPFQIPNMGVLNFFDAFLLLTGVFYLIRNNTKLLKFIFIWILIAVFPAALTYITPSANRSFNMLPALMIISAFGFYSIIFSGKYKKILINSIIVCILVSFSYFIYQYFIILPKQYAYFWHYGYKEVYSQLKKEESNYDYLLVSDKLSMPYIFILFYNQVDPNTLSKDLVRNYKSDAVGFEFVDGYKNYRFLRYFDWNNDKDRLPKNSLLVTTIEEKVNINDIYKQIKYPDGKPAFNIYEIK